MPAAPAFVFNPSAKVTHTPVGRGQIAVTRIDDALLDPEGAAALGLAQSYAKDPNNFYPGMRAVAPESFSTALRAWLTPILQGNGVLKCDQALYRDASFFSVVTTAGTDLLPIQRIPHYDSTDPKLLAAVIYLCRPPPTGAGFSGTSFYRHRRTGYEQITEANHTNYQLALDHDMRTHGPPKREYADGDSTLFETIFSVPLRFNTAVIYPSRILHAANIHRHFTPPKDPGEWRLTITATLQAT
jgi:Family of unknown function (DUF6445)